MSTYEILLGLIALTNFKEFSNGFIEIYENILFKNNHSKEYDIINLKYFLKIILMIILIFTGIAIMYMIFIKNNYNPYDLYNTIIKLGFSFIISLIIYINSERIFNFLNNIFSKSIILEILKIYSYFNYLKLAIGIFILNIILILKLLFF